MQKKSSPSERSFWIIKVLHFWIINLNAITLVKILPLHNGIKAGTWPHVAFCTPVLYNFRKLQLGVARK